MRLEDVTRDSVRLKECGLASNTLASATTSKSTAIALLVSICKYVIRAN